MKPSPEGPTVESVHFTKPGDWRPLNLVDIPVLVFSEVMRDVDLVVSVAHAGGVDPEASASTVEMRAGLAKEICSLLGFENVRSEGSHVLIDGKLSGYSVHLGSAVVHRMPGGQLFRDMGPELEAPVAFAAPHKSAMNQNFRHYPTDFLKAQETWVCFHCKNLITHAFRQNVRPETGSLRAENFDATSQGEKKHGPVHHFVSFQAGKRFYD